MYADERLLPEIRAINALVSRLPPRSAVESLDGNFEGTEYLLREIQKAIDAFKQRKAELGL